MKFQESPAAPSLADLLSTGVTLDALVLEARRFAVQYAVSKEHGNHSKAAMRLGIHRNTLSRIISEAK